MTERPTILGIPFDAVSVQMAVDRTLTALAGSAVFQVVTPGPEFLMTSRHHAQFREVLQRADLSLPDGMGVVLAAKYLGQPGLRRIPGMEYLESLLAELSRKQIPVFFYGGMPGVADEAVRQLSLRFSGLRIAGAESGFRKWLRVPEAYICWRIRQSGAAVVFVALGAPEQELWIDRNRERLGLVRIAIGVGGAFDFWSKRIRRAPVWLRRLGLEWFWRLLQEPGKRWRRILTATWSFTHAVLREKWRTHA